MFVGRNGVLHLSFCNVALFYGTVFHTKGDKIETWNEFLKDFRDPDSKLFIPVKTNVAAKSPSHNKKTGPKNVIKA